MRGVRQAIRDRHLDHPTASRHIMRPWLVLSLTIGLAACRGDERAPASDSARGEVSAPADTGMAGMDHSKMPGMSPDTATPMAGMDHSKMPGMGTKTAPANAMAGMDHSKMPGMGTKTAPADAMAGMDHSKMSGMATKTATPNAMAGMDHSKMPGMGTKTAAPTAMPAMDHSNMPGMSGAATAATTTAADAKLDRLVATLLNDPIVRQRIQSDSALRRRWDEAARRTLLPSRP